MVVIINRQISRKLWLTFPSLSPFMLFFFSTLVSSFVRNSDYREIYIYSFQWLNSFTPPPQPVSWLLLIPTLAQSRGIYTHQLVKCWKISRAGGQWAKEWGKFAEFFFVFFLHHWNIFDKAAWSRDVARMIHSGVCWRRVFLVFFPMNTRHNSSNDYDSTCKSSAVWRPQPVSLFISTSTLVNSTWPVRWQSEVVKENCSLSEKPTKRKLRKLLCYQFCRWVVRIQFGEDNAMFSSNGSLCCFSSNRILISFSK